MTEITLQEQQARLYDYEKGFHATYLINAGLDLGLFQTLNDFESGANYSELAGQLGLHEPYIRTWCYTAYHLGILDCNEDGKFSLAPHMGTLLTDTSSPFYFGHRPRFMVSYVADSLEKYPEDVKSGNRFFYDDLEGDYGRKFSRDVKALSNQVVPIAFMYAVIPRIPMLKEKLSAGAKVLDVGCGSALLMIRLAQAYPNCEFTGIEVDRFARDDAHRDIKDNKLEDRVSVLLVNSSTINYDKDFDLVTMGFVLHEIAPDLKNITIANCYSALKDSGEIAILDFAYPQMIEDFRNNMYSLGIMDQFMETTWNSQHLSSQSKHELLMEHGFKNPTTIPIADGSLEATYATK